MLMRGVSTLTSYEGAACDDLEARVKKHPSCHGIRSPSDRPAWGRDPWPYVTLEGRRKLRNQEYRVEFQDSLVHDEWLRRADYVSPEPEHRRSQGLPE
eukprot:7642108-Pyramimonas_sp.AAC.1